MNNVFAKEEKQYSALYLAKITISNFQIIFQFGENSNDPENEEKKFKRRFLYDILKKNYENI
jgi:hypothetical protein